MLQIILRVLLCVNALLDLVPLGFMVLFAPDVEVPAPNLLTMFPEFGATYDFRHRAVAYYMILAGFARGAAGLTKAPVAVNLAVLSYLMEAMMFWVETHQYTTTKFTGDAQFGFFVPIVMSVILLSGVLSDSADKKAKTN